MGDRFAFYCTVQKYTVVGREDAAYSGVPHNPSLLVVEPNWRAVSCIGKKHDCRFQPVVMGGRRGALRLVWNQSFRGDELSHHEV